MIMQCFRSSRGYSIFFLLYSLSGNGGQTDGKPKGQPIGTALREKEGGVRRYHLVNEYLNPSYSSTIIDQSMQDNGVNPVFF